jgi:hypothetical protein
MRSLCILYEDLLWVITEHETWVRNVGGGVRGGSSTYREWFMTDILLHLHQHTVTCSESEHKGLDTSDLHVTSSTRSFNQIRFLEQQTQHIKGKKKLRLQSYILQTKCKIQLYTQKSTSVLDMTLNYCQLWATIMRPWKVSQWIDIASYIPPSAFKPSLIFLPPPPTHTHTQPSRRSFHSASGRVRLQSYGTSECGTIACHAQRKGS